MTLSTVLQECTNDYHTLPATERQRSFARRIAAQARIDLPGDVETDRRALSDWIDRHKTQIGSSRFDMYPSSKQVGFAEAIARRKRRHVPRECFRDKALMSRWIDANR